MKPAVEIFEVGPRDGLQNEPAFISSEDKIALTEALAGAGLLRVECASFVSPRWVPQMADGAQVVQGVTPGAAQLYALAPNMRGLQAALATPVGEFVCSSRPPRVLAGPIQMFRSRVLWSV